ncbi:hypothetical protein [Aeromonas caviae]|uniref:Tail spike TSP1/Gp66 N-terminal domain-containing protein n=1 Tax=Aeromonas caviae TaxID=648 RepID=A0AAW9EYW7_AERCA|nr:hypothetical protein [Aeromonas caviae]MDX7721034.1 hypothetical protein [Aeromonas caviae]
MAYWPDTGTGVDTQPARKPVQSAIRKYFTEGGIGQPPTVPGGDWFNQMTNEVLNVLEEAGIEPSKVDDDQLLKAIQSISNAEGSYEALRRTYADAGLYLRPAPENFKNGGTLTSANDVLLDKSSGKAYSGSGPFPQTVAADSIPGPVFTDRSPVILRNELFANLMKMRDGRLSLKYYIHASDYGVVDDYYIITPTLLAQAIGEITGYSYDVVINPNPTDNADKIQKASNELAPGGVLSFAGMRGVGISRTIQVMTERVSVVSDNKFMSHILPVPGFSGTCLFKFGDGTQAYQRTTGIGYIAAISPAGDDVSGIEAHNFYNFEAVDIKAQSGNYITRECAGIDLLDGRHTLIQNSNLHNSFCYGMIIRKHLTGLKLYANAFDESDCSLVSRGNIVEMFSVGNEFGASRPNPVHPAPVNGISMDLRIGVHGAIAINDLFSGGGGTKYHIRWSDISNLTIDGVLSNATRFAVAGNQDVSRTLTILGTYANNGTARTSDDPSTGTSDPDTSPFCSDIHLAKAFQLPTVIAVTSRATIPVAWVEGASNALATCNVTLSGTSNHLSAGAVAFVHNTLIKNNMDLQRGLLNYKTLGALTFNIAGATVTNGTGYSGVVTVPGAVVGDTVSVVFKDSTTNYNLIISGRVQSNNIVRWVIVNTSSTPIALAATDIVISVSKTK